MAIANGTMNYTYKLADGSLCKVENIPVADVKALRKEFSLTDRDAINLWLSKNGYTPAYEVDVKSAGKTPAPEKQKKARAKTIDCGKQAIMKVVYEALMAADFAGVVGKDTSNVVLENDQRLVTFSLGDASYKLTLTKDRASKK